MNRDFRYWLRWIAVLPGAALAGLLALFPLHWALYTALSKVIEPYPALPERLLIPLVFGAVFIRAGSGIAPRYSVETAVGLFGLWMALLGGFVFLVLSGGSMVSRVLYLYGGWLGPVMALTGGLVGLYLVRRDSTRQSRVITSA